nr:SusC/RagA family TonB-linked outer membrane protein [Pedobacter sp. ASV19]
MKLIIIIMTTCLLQVSAATFAQKFTYAKKDATYGLVFKEIIKQTGYKILYSDQILDKTKTINVDFKGAELKEVMETLLKNQPLTYEIDETTILIKEKEPTFLDRLAKRWASIDANGRVVDSENRPLPGASVKVKATGKAVSTDEKGRFFLRGVEEGAVLVVSFIGYLPKEVNASANMGNLVLEQSLSKLDEVQVIAYGTTTQRLSTGNVTTIKADVIEKQPVNNPLLALQGRVPGLFIEQATGFAGTGVKVRIQGTNSIANGNDPLYVVDGIPFTSQLLPGGNSILGQSGGTTGTQYGNPLNFINPADIESLDVLKDADATAIYGSRAANGAILITTKKGKPGDIKVDANLQSGWGKVMRKLDLMNSQQYVEMRKEAYKNDNIDLNQPPYNTEFYKAYTYPDLSLWDTSRYTDWQKQLIGGTAQYHDLQASISGGSDLTTFLVGAGYHKEGNVFPGNFDDVKSSLHFNINSISRNTKFKIQFSGSYLEDDNKLPNYDLTGYAMKLAPVAPALYTSCLLYTSDAADERD